MPEDTRVVFDVNIYITAVHDRDSPPLPDKLILPPISNNPGLISLSVVRQGMMDDKFHCALFVSSHILENIVWALRRFNWPNSLIDDYLDLIEELADDSGGGIVDPSSVVTDCTDDYEDNRILELALDTEAHFIVSNDHHLTDMSPWRMKPIIRADRFWFWADGARRR